MERIKKMASYLKPYKFTLLFLLFVLLFQQICSLFLPTLMSDVVDVGIRQSGIENGAPNAMSTKAYELTTYFMDNKEKEEVKSNYEFVTVNRAKAGYNNFYIDYKMFNNKPINEIYPILEKEDIYVLKQNHTTKRENLDVYFENAALRLIKYMNDNQIDNISSEDGRYYKINLETAYNVILNKSSDIDNKYYEINKENTPDKIDIAQAVAILNKGIYKELGMDITKNQTLYILKIGMLMLIVTLITMAITIFENYLSSKMSSGISMKLRSDVFNKVESFSAKEFDEISSASLITRTTNDVSQVKDVILMGIQFIIPPVMLAGGLIMAIRKSYSMSWTILLGALVSSIIICISFGIVLPKINVMQKIIDKFNLITRERLMGSMVIKSFGTQVFEERRFEDANVELTNISCFVNRVMTFMSPILTIFMNFISLLIIWLGAQEIAESAMQIGDIMAFTQYATMVISAFLMLVMMIAMIPRALISVNRIFEVLEKEPSVQDSENPVNLNKDFKGKIEFKNVSFKYNEAKENVINDVSFTAEPGKVTAIIGSTGSGKSTLVKLIPRLYDVTDGEILLDGVNIKDIPQKELRDKIAFAQQDASLFSGSIEYNLKYGNQDADNEKLEECIKVAQIDDMINESKDGIQSEVMQAGKNFSGGQKQRLSIARTLVKGAKINIFDDSFSALDFKTDSLIRKEMKEYFKDDTVIIVAQRIGTVMGADKIVVLNEGKVVGEGKHEILINTCPAYRQIAESQLSEEELNYER